MLHSSTRINCCCRNLRFRMCVRNNNNNNNVVTVYVYIFFFTKDRSSSETRRRHRHHLESAEKTTAGRERMYTKIKIKKQILSSDGETLIFTCSLLYISVFPVSSPPILQMSDKPHKTTRITLDLTHAFTQYYTIIMIIVI